MARHFSDQYYPHEALNLKPVKHWAASDTLGPSGIMANNNQSYLFLKARPYTNQAGNTLDPVSRRVADSYSFRLDNMQKKMYEVAEKTKRQIRYNEFTRSGGSVQRHHGFDFTSDYHRAANRDNAQRVLSMAGVAMLAGLILL